jgi:exonuclease VII small subunit
MKKTFLVLSIVAAMATIMTAAAQKPGARGSNRDLHQGMKLAHQAHELLKSALPVYDGNRVDAMEMVRWGNKELEDALKGISDVGVTPKVRPHKKSLMLDGQKRAAFAGDQVAASDKKLSDAEALINEAIQKLDNADPLYHGERMDAISRFKTAIGYLQKALSIR